MWKTFSQEQPVYFGSSSRDPIPFKNGTTIKAQELNVFTVCETVLLAPICRSSNVVLAPNFYNKRCPLFAGVKPESIN
jgi:hypothetical protein